MIVLSNGKSLQRNEETPPIVLFHGFMEALFDIEQDYSSNKETFVITKKSGNVRTRQLNHVTRSDIYTAIILHTVCHATTHNIKNVMLSNIYEELSQWFEDPITLQDFINSMTKLNKKGLISYSNERLNGRFDIQLNYIKKNEEDKARFVVVHPVVFTKAFTDLTVSHWKVFLLAALQTGKDKGKVITRKFDNEQHAHVLYRGLKQITHKQQSSDVKRILVDLASLPMMEGQPLLGCKSNSVDMIVRRGKKFYRADFVLNSNYVLKHESGKHYHFPIQPKSKYKRFSTFLHNLLDEQGITEFMTVEKENIFHDMLYALKDKGKTVTRYVVRRLAAFVKSKKQFHPDIVSFIKEESRTKLQAKIENLAHTEGIYGWIAPNKRGSNEKYRLYEFSNRMSFFSERTLRKLFRAAVPYLKSYHSADSNYSIDDYIHGEDKVETVLHQIPALSAVRRTALRNKKNPKDYITLEETAVTRLEEGTSALEVGNWLLTTIEQLPTVETAPSITKDFKLEEFLINFKKQMA